jgi:signal transduction histidine kinase
MTRPAILMIGPHGEVLAAAGDLPPGLVDLPLESCQALPVEVRAAARTLLDRLPASGNRVVTETVRLDGLPLQLIAVEALAIRRSPIDLRALLRSKLAVLHSQAMTAGIALTVEFTEDVPELVPVDPEKVAWAVTTLVGNAIRYAHTGSRTLHGTSVVVRTFRDTAARLVIEVQDDGPGVPADTVGRLFKRDGLNVRGAGLALLVIADVMAGHGGTVDVRSSTDAQHHGTAVRLTFPAN